VLWHGTVGSEHVLAYFTGRNEEEIVVDSRAMSFVERNELRIESVAEPTVG
jgi:hypothetical protein